MKIHHISPFALLTALALGLSACSVAPPGTEVYDPYEAQNRQIHAFNLALDEAILRDAGAAAAALPPVIRQPVVNFSDNVALPGMVLNGILQADIGGAGTNAMRFVLNTVLGFGGLIDVASEIGLYEDSTDFGETLAVWGVPEGAYQELPFFGPSTERDTFGLIVDMVIDPLGRYGTAEQLRYGGYARVAEQVIDRGVFGDTVDSILYDSADGYAQARLYYLQNRRFGIEGTAGEGNTDTFVDPFEDF
ncbi:MAG: VacJ family lipoprotein [Rhodobacteraceae bacterium]|nr:VacJ family lipoprotein [Paracoccaceae bacterium]